MAREATGCAERGLRRRPSSSFPSSASNVIPTRRRNARRAAASAAAVAAAHPALESIGQAGASMNRGLRSPTHSRARSRPAWWRGSIFAGVLLLGGCAPNGDFGRVRPSLVSDDMHAWVGRDAGGSVRALAFAAPLTDDERLLRDLAYPLIEPPFDRNRWYSVLGEYGAGPARLFALPRSEVNPTAYWHRLEAEYRRSESSRDAQLIRGARHSALRSQP